MDAMTVPLDEARNAFVASVDGLIDAADSLSEYELLGSTRCHGWTRLDLLVHVIGGWQEVLGGIADVTDEPPTIDASGFWRWFASHETDSDAVADLMEQRRRTASYARPIDAVAQLHRLADVVRSSMTSIEDRRRRWLGQVFTAGDFLTIWAVEHAVHHLDLELTGPVGSPSTAPIALSRRTVEALLPGVDRAWPSEQVVLVASGRIARPEGWPHPERVPVIG